MEIAELGKTESNVVKDIIRKKGISDGEAKLTEISCRLPFRNRDQVHGHYSKKSQKEYHMKM